MQIPASTNSRLERLRQHRSNIRRCARELGIELGGSSAPIANRPDQASSTHPHADLIVVGESAGIDRRESAGAENRALRTSSEVMRTRLKPVGANYPTLATNADNLVQGWLQQDTNMSERYSDHHMESSRRNHPEPNLQSEDGMLAHKAQGNQDESAASRSSTQVLRPAIEASNLAATFSSSASASKHLDDRSFMSEHSIVTASEQGLQDLQGTLSQSLSPQSKPDDSLLAASNHVRPENQFGAQSSQLTTGEAQARQSASSSASQLLAAVAWQEDVPPMSSKHTAEDMRSPSGRHGVLDSSLRPVAEEIQSPPYSASGHEVEAPPTFGGILERWRNLNSDFQQVVNQSAGLPEASISYSSSSAMHHDSDDPEMVLQRIKRDLGLGGDPLEGIGDELQMPKLSVLSGRSSSGAQSDFFKELPNLGAKSDFFKNYPKDFGLRSPFLEGLPSVLAGVPSAKPFDSVSQGSHQPMMPKVFDSFKVGSRPSDVKDAFFARQDSSSPDVEVEHILDLKRKPPSEVVLNDANASSNPGALLNGENLDCKLSSDGALLEEQLDHWHDLDYSRTDVTEVSMEFKGLQQLETESIANRLRQASSIGLRQASNTNPQDRLGDIGSLSLSPRRPGDATSSLAGDVADRFQHSTTSLMLSSTASSLFGSRVDMQSTSDSRQNADIGISTMDVLRGPADESAGPPATRNPSKSVQHSGSQTTYAEFRKPQQDFRDAEVDTSELESLHTDQRRVLESPIVQRQTVETQTTPRAPSRSSAGINIDVHSPRTRPPLLPQPGSPSGVWDGGVLDQFRFSSHRLQSARSSSSPPLQSSRVDLNGYSCLAPAITRQNMPHDAYQMLHHYPKPNPPLQEDCSTRNFGLPLHASHAINNHTSVAARFGSFSGYASHEHSPFGSCTPSIPAHEIGNTILSERDDKLLTRAYEVYRQQQLDLMRGR